MNHCLRKISHDVVNTVHSLNEIAGVVDKEIVDAVMMDDRLTELKQKNSEIAISLPQKVNSFFDELIAEIQETRKKVLESVTTSTTEKETRVNTLIMQNEELKAKFSNVGEGVHDLLQRIKGSKYLHDQEFKPKSEELASLHKQAQESLTYLKAQSETDDIKVADFSHAKNNCLPKFRDALESTLRLSTLVEPSVEFSRALTLGRPPGNPNDDHIPLDDLNDAQSRLTVSSRGSRSRSAGSRFARALSDLNLGLGPNQQENSRSSRTRSRSGSRRTHSRRLEISVSHRSRISDGSRDHMRVFFQGYPWIDNPRDELLDGNRNHGRGLEPEYPQRNNYIGRNQNFSALEVIERITQAHNRAPPVPTSHNSSNRSSRQRRRSVSHDSDGVDNNSGTEDDGIHRTISDETASHVSRRNRSRIIHTREATRSRSQNSRNASRASRRSSHNSELNREVLHRAISDLNRMEQAQRRSGNHSNHSSVSSAAGARPYATQAPSPENPPQSVQAHPRPSLNFFSSSPFSVPARPSTTGFFFPQPTPPSPSTVIHTGRAPPS